MNTEIYLWIEPLASRYLTPKKRVYFNCVVNEDVSHLEINELEELIAGKTMQTIMDENDIHSNWNFAVISAKRTSKAVSIESTLSPEERKKQQKERKKQQKISSLIKSKKEIQLTKDNVTIMEDGKLMVSLSSIDFKQEIDFKKIWISLEDNVIGKIKEGDKITINNQNGDPIIDIIGGSYLNVGLADLSVYDKSKKPKYTGLTNWAEGFKGGLFVRKDGNLDIGDLHRTFYLRIHTNRLIKESLKLNKNMSELADIKLLTQKTETKNTK